MAIDLVNIKEKLTEQITKILGIPEHVQLELPIVKRNRNLKEGDFVIPLDGFFKLLHPSKCSKSEIKDCLATAESYGPYCTFNSITNQHLYLNVNRKLICQKALSYILSTEKPFDMQREPKETMYLNMILPESKDSMITIRGHLIMQHLNNLFVANGYSTCKISHLSLPELLQPCSETDSSLTSSTSHTKEMADLLLQNKCCSLEKDSDSSQNSELNRISVDFQSFMRDRNLSQGKGGYDKNIGVTVLEDGDYRLEQLGKLHTSQVDQTKDDASAMKGLIHLSYGPVVTRKDTENDTPMISEFYRLRESETIECFKMKYGLEVLDEKWSSIIRGLTLAAIKFELLSTSFQSPVKVDLQPCVAGGGSTSRAGVFVMYNYARLATLHEHFLSSVQQGTYPPLPAITQIQFDELKEEEEWELVYNYVLTYQDVIQSAVSGVHTGSLTPFIYTHKVCQFLLDLSRALSSYYSRVHVLGEGLSHLLPKMYARLGLLQVIQKIMEHGLWTLDISPISQL